VFRRALTLLCATVVVIFSGLITTSAPAYAASSNLQFVRLAEIENDLSGFCLTAHDSSTNGAKIYQDRCGLAQDEWKIYQDLAYLPSVVYEFRNQDSDKCLADPSSSQTAGAQFIQWTCNNFDSQRFWIKNLDTTTELGFAENLASTLYMDDKGASLTAGAAVIQWTFNGQLNQKWYFAASPATGPCCVE